LRPGPPGRPLLEGKGNNVSVYFNGRYIPKQEVRVSPDDRAFLFADGVYEVIRTYEGRLFRLEEHLARFSRSLCELRISGVDAAGLADVAQELLDRNGLTDGAAKIYLQVTRGAAERTHTFPVEPPPPTVYGAAARVHDCPEERENGFKAILVPDLRWARCDIKSLALLPNVLAAQQASEAGAEEAILVRDGAVTEGSHTNVCAVFDGELVTAPLSNYILPGITRQAVLELCGEVGVPVRLFPILTEQLKRADEIMIVGTTTEVGPVVQVDERRVGDGRPGPVARQLQEAFRELTRRA